MLWEFNSSMGNAVIDVGVEWDATSGRLTLFVSLKVLPEDGVVWGVSNREEYSIPQLREKESVASFLERRMTEVFRSLPLPTDGIVEHRWNDLKRLLEKVEGVVMKDVSPQSEFAPKERAVSQPQPTEVQSTLPALERIYKKLAERGYDQDDIYLIIDVCRKVTMSDIFPLQNEEFSALETKLFSPIGDEKGLNLVLTFLDANPRLKQQLQVPYNELTLANIRNNPSVKEYYYKVIVKSLRYAVFHYINDRLKKKVLRDNLSAVDLEGWWGADYYFIRFHILEGNITARWLT